MRFSTVILAAGASTRLGKQPKQLIEYGGIPFVRRAAIAALDAGAASVVVVLGFDAEKIGASLDGLPNVRKIINPDWKSGLASSMSAGLAALSDDDEIDAAMIMLADQPLVDADELRRLAGAFGEKRIVASAYAGTVGVPALFGREYFSELCRLEGDQGAGKWLRARLEEVTAIPLSGPALDIDTTDDLARLMEE